ncbi:hypothetical protein OG588_40630 [Streptomyces prunicolor]|uniref:hypothetical protein n=1 Tax=Streptomyces prunicolor TaxID=67348 RepID=UPI00386EF0E9|nr:hypothetical protein OG588_40630 [Streptomyces prunicolor]
MSFLTDAIEAIQANWVELDGLLDEPAREELREILAEAEADPEAAADELRALVKPFVPTGHPLRAALTPQGVRFQAESTQPQSKALLPLLKRLRTQAQVSPAASLTGPLDSSYRPDPQDAWLLAEPAVLVGVLSPDQTQDLILLTDEQNTERVPAFQLDPASGTPYPIVVEINRLLSADEDPWGAADWWLGSNVWLDAAPARLLGTGADDALLSAARAEIPEW